MTHRHILHLLGLTVAAMTTASAQTADWKDPAPHAVKLVAVDSAAQLEVLDWGGSGRPVILLAGLGDTGHVWDDFAPMLTPRYRVIAITRRAHGRSASPANGYEFARLAQDVVRVMDTLKLDRPLVIGHSFAGEEMHVLGARYADRVAGLVYVDAAFNRGDDSDNAAYNAIARLLPAAPRPDLSSVAALATSLKNTQGTPFPEAHLRARYVVNPDGTIARMWAPEAAVRQEITKQMQAAYASYNPERIRVPALAIYAAPRTAADLMRPWFPAGDPAIRPRLDSLFVLERARLDAHVKWFRQFATGARVTEIAGPHHLFVSHPREVLSLVDSFAASLPNRR